MTTFSIGDEVALPQGHRAILRWIGRIPGRPPIEYAGVEVVGPDAAELGKHSGTYQGHQYFQTRQPGTGLFISYTQLLSANIKTPRLGPPPSPSQMSLDESATSFSGFNTPATRAASPSRDLDTPSRAMSPLSSISVSAVPSSAMQRSFFREAIRVTNEKVAALSADFEAKLAETKAHYEEQMAKVRRSNALLGTTPESEVEKQRLALATMQNELINERAEKQEEIDGLKRELLHMRKLAGTAEDLEALVGDLSKYEQQLAELRSQVNEVDKLKEELGRLRSQNAALELASRSNRSFESKKVSHVDQSAEIQRLESILESKLVRESELEAMNERLQEELDSITSKASQPLTPDPDIHTSSETVKMIPKVPVPEKLNHSFDESSMMVDLAAGRADWCSLCEREGHSAVDCPYE